MQIAYILIAITSALVAATAYNLSKEIKARSDADEKMNDVMAGWMSGTTSRLVELERRIGCVENDLEKIPVEEVKAEAERLERFNDGIASIMSYGPDVPRLNKDAVTK